MTTANAFNLVTLYKEYFGRGSYYVDQSGLAKPAENVSFSGLPQNPNPRGTIHFSKKNISFNKTGYYGQDIWHPIELRSLVIEDGKEVPINIFIDACTISINLLSTIVSTPVVERKGTVNEIINHDDYKFTIRGFLIGKDRKFPEDEIMKLVKIKESTSVKTLHGGYPEMFLSASCQIVISDLEFPEVQGQNYWIRPFSMICKSDFIIDLDFK